MAQRQQLSPRPLKRVPLLGALVFTLCFTNFAIVMTLGAAGVMEGSGQQ